MSVMVLLELTVQVHDQDEVIGMVSDMLSATRDREGCLDAGVYTHSEQPGTIMVVERWKDRADHETYVAWRTERGDPEGLVPRFSEAPRVTYLEEFSTTSIDA